MRKKWPAGAVQRRGVARRNDNLLHKLKVVADRAIGGKVGARQAFYRIADDRPYCLAGGGIGRVLL